MTALSQIQNDNKEEFRISSIDRRGKPSCSIVYASSSEEAGEKFKRSSLGTKRKIEKISQIKITDSGTFAGEENTIALPQISASPA